MGKLNSMWYVYMARCADNSLYTGITTCLQRRIDEHNNCDKKGAKYTRVRRPVILAYAAMCDSRQMASRTEYQLKKLTKAKKEKLVADFTPSLLTKIETDVRSSP